MTAIERIDEALRQLDAVAHLGAVVARDDEAVGAEAARLDGLSGEGLLHGTPVTVKDWIDVAGFPCEGESSERTDRRPTSDATAVARLRAAGAVVVAKTQPGASHPIHGDCQHPLDPKRSPGGTSSGEAALIGAGASELGLGSDSGGSIRLPAAWCGVAGLKPTFGLVPDTGHFPHLGGHHDGRTVIGPMAASVGPLHRALAMMAGPDGIDGSCVPVPVGDPANVNIDGLRIATLAVEDSSRAAASTRDAVDRAVSALTASGAVVVDGVVPAHLDESFDITVRYWSRAHLSGLEANQQLWDWDRFVRRFTRAAASFDIVIGPVVTDVAPLARPMAVEDYLFTLAWSLTGWPAVSVPAGTDADTGMPLAVQVAAPRWHDHVALAAAGCLEDAFAHGD